MTNLREHAKMELEILGEDPDVIDWYLKVIDAFREYGHSGGSASVAIPTLNALLQFQNLSPLTNNPDEWMHIEKDVAAIDILWQSRRNPEAFSNDGGKTYTLLSERDKGSPTHTSKEV